MHRPTPIEIFSGPIDLLLVPISWTRDIIQEAGAAMALLHPRQVVPMHYWSAQEKRDFLAYLTAQNETVRANYQIQEIGGAEYDVWIDSADVTPIQVISQATRLLRQFDRAARHYRPVLIAHLAGESPEEEVTG